MRMGRDAHEQVAELFKLVRWVETLEVGLPALSGWLGQINVLCDEIAEIAKEVSDETKQHQSRQDIL